MAEILPRNIIIALVMVFFGFTAGLFMFSGIYSAQSVNLPDQVNALASNLSVANSSVNTLADGVSSSYDSEKSAGWVSSSCTALLGDDNFFCAGIKTLGAISDAPSNMRLTINVFKYSFPIDIPPWVFSTLATILAVTIIFVIVSAYRRYRS